LNKRKLNKKFSLFNRKLNKRKLSKKFSLFNQKLNKRKLNKKFNLLNREPADSGIIDFCHESGIGFIAFSPLAQGLLTNRYLNGIPEGSRMSKAKFLRPEMLTPQLLTQLQQLNDIAAKRGQTLAQMALQWILKQQGVTSVLVGASSVEQLQNNLQCIAEAEKMDF
jgi:L-glyceraldehyde 3-phosphate reductase